MSFAAGQHQNLRPGYEASALHYVPVVKHDTNNFTEGFCKGLLVGTAGTANLVQPDGTERDDVPLQAGYNPICVLRVKTGGTADDIWALY